MTIYKVHPMSARDKDGVLIGLLIRAKIAFNKIHEKRVAQCQNAKWEKILEEVRVDVTEALERCDLQKIRDFTAELENMDESLLFPPPSTDSHKLAQEAIDRAKGTHPEGMRFYHLRRRKQVWTDRQGNLIEPKKEHNHNPPHLV